MSTVTTPLTAPAGIDPRGPRVAATLTSVVLALVLVTPQPVATGLALVAALLNAVFGFCLGCEIYLLLRRASVR